MKIVKIEQGSPEWLQWRLQGIGGSDAPVVFGNSPYRTPLQLFREKRGLPIASDQEDNEILFARGHQSEKIARAQFFDLTGVEMTPICVVHSQFEHIRTSLDGFDPKKYGVLEAKLVGQAVLAQAKKAGSIPEHHFTQLQHEMECADVDRGLWFGRDPKGNAAIVEVKRDKEYIKRLLTKEHGFWELVKSGVAPDLTKEDYLYPENDALLVELRDAKERAENSQQYFEDLKERVVASFSALNHPKIAGGGVKLFQVSRQGSIDYLSIPEIKKVLEKLKPEYLEKFRKAGSTSWTVRLDKPAKGEK
jgi:putative phage-type endonuclease